MKGIAHFISGVAAATFFPAAVHAAADQQSFLIVLGGIGGILPDTLDFKFARYFTRPQVVIDPDPQSPDPQAIADALAEALRRAYQGEAVEVQLHTMKLGADLWRRYTVYFDADAGEVITRIGPVVTTSQVPFPGSEPDLPPGRAQVGIPFRPTYDAETKVDIFSGPSFLFQRRGDAVEITFLPWHRRWSHSLTLAAALGLLGAVLFGRLGGLLLGLGAAVHILEDQLGHMGSNLFYPFTKRRIPGLKLLRSGDALPNLFTVWLSLVVILFNLDRFSPQPVLQPVSYFLTTLALPWAFILTIASWRERGREPVSEGAVEAREMLSEAEEVET